MVDYYVEKARSVLQNQRYSEVMTSLKTGFKGAKGGYRFQEPKTPFGKILLELNVKLKPLNKKNIFITNLKKVRVGLEKGGIQKIQDILNKLHSRSEFMQPQLEYQMTEQDQYLSVRLKERRAASHN